MEIHVRELASRNAPLQIRESLNADWLKQVRKDVVSAGPLEVNLTARGESGIVHVEGELAIEVSLSCSRCLEPVAERSVTPFHEKFKPAATATDSEPEDIIVVEEDKVDLEPLLEETMMLSLPFVPLCSEDCKGLCHTCGANLNDNSCGCSNDRIDPRFAALKDLFKS